MTTSQKNKKPKIVIVMPAYNAERTVEKTFKEIPKGFVSEVILVDDNSRDRTVDVAKSLNIKVFTHHQNLGYGGNQKTCYWEALKKKPDVIVMLHADYQYDGSLIEELVSPVLEGKYDVMFGSRIRTREEAISGGMPLYKYLINRALSIFENVVLGVNLSEHLSGFRAYSREVLLKVPFQRFSNDFVFDQQFMISAIARGFKVGEIPIPIRYFDEASSIKSLRGLKFLLGTFVVLGKFILFKLKIYKDPIFCK